MRIELARPYEEQERLHREIEERQASREAHCNARKSEVEAHKASLPGEQLQRRREATLKNLAGDRGLVAARGSLYGDQVKARASRAGPHRQAPVQQAGQGVRGVPGRRDGAGFAAEDHKQAICSPTAPSRRRRLRYSMRWLRTSSQSTLRASVSRSSAPSRAPRTEDQQEALAIVDPDALQDVLEVVERAEDLAALIAYRVVRCVGRMLQQVGAADAPLQYAEYENALAIQVWLGDSDVTGNIERACWMTSSTR